MPSGFFWGGLMQGAGQGFEKGQRLQMEREEAKLKAKMLDAQLKHMDAQTRAEEAKQKERDQIQTGRRDAADMFMSGATGAQPGLPQVETDVGDQPVGLQVEGQPGAPKAGRKPNLQELLTGQAIREGNASQALNVLSKVEDNSPEAQWNRLMTQDTLMKRYAQLQQQPQAVVAQPQQDMQIAPGPTVPTTPQTTPGAQRPPALTPAKAPPYRITFDAKGKPKLTPTPSERTPLDVASRTYFDARNAGQTHEEALTAAAGARESLSTASAQGPFNAKGKESNLTIERNFKEAGAQGTARGSPIPEGAAKEIGGLDQVVTDARLALQHFDPQLVGPGAGVASELQRYYGETPVIGALVNKMGTGAPITESQTTFMQAIARVKNAIRTKEFGATLTGNEKKAAEQELASMTESPGSAKVRLQNIERIFATAAARQRGLTGQTRGGGNVQGSSPPRIISITPVQ